MSLIPEVPGQTVEPQFLKVLRSRVKELVGVSNFPGAQPISFISVHLQELQNENYFVCEKTDGTRVLVYVICDKPGQQQVFLIDRKNYYRFIPHLLFPIPGDPTFSQFHHETLIDGELVNDFENGNVTLKLLTFDLLVIDGKNLMSRPLTSRLGYLNEQIIIPYNAMLSKRPDLAQKQSFFIELKKMEFSYGLEKVLKTIIPNLKHKSDGLIFTSSISGYKTGTCEKMLKWKPPHENSIDFQLRLDFSQVQSDDEKPKFCLYKWIQKDEHTYFNDMNVTDEEWKKFWKDDYQQYERRIVEVVYDSSMNPSWRFSRFRDDKPHANHHSVIEKIMRSITDGITEEQLLSCTSVIRDAWKRREKNLADSNKPGGEYKDSWNEKKEEQWSANANKHKELKSDKSENENKNAWERKEKMKSLAYNNKPEMLKYDYEDKSKDEDKHENVKMLKHARESKSEDEDKHENVKKVKHTYEDF